MEGKDDRIDINSIVHNCYVGHNDIYGNKLYAGSKIKFIGRRDIASGFEQFEETITWVRPKCGFHPFVSYNVIKNIELVQDENE